MVKDRPTWMAEAACAGMDPAVFYPVRGEDEVAAKDVCRGCAVVADCLEHALADGERPRRMGRHQRAPAPSAAQEAGPAQTVFDRAAIMHGTGSTAYYACLARFGGACVPCRAAHAADQRSKKLERLAVR